MPKLVIFCRYFNYIAACLGKFNKKTKTDYHFFKIEHFMPVFFGATFHIYEWLFYFKKTVIIIRLLMVLAISGEKAWQYALLKVIHNLWTGKMHITHW